MGEELTIGDVLPGEWSRHKCRGILVAEKLWLPWHFQHPFMFCVVNFDQELNERANEKPRRTPQLLCHIERIPSQTFGANWAMIFLPFALHPQWCVAPLLLPSLPTSDGTSGVFCFAITPLCIAIPRCLLRTGDVRTDRHVLLSKQLIPLALQILWIFIPSCDILLISTAVSFSGFDPSAHGVVLYLCSPAAEEEGTRCTSPVRGSG